MTTPNNLESMPLAIKLEESVSQDMKNESDSLAGTFPLINNSKQEGDIENQDLDAEFVGSDQDEEIEEDDDEAWSESLDNQDLKLHQRVTRKRIKRTPVSISLFYVICLAIWILVLKCEVRTWLCYH